MNLQVVVKTLLIFGDVIILTQWPLDEEVTENARTDVPDCEPGRTLDDGDANQRHTDVDIKYHERSYRERY